MYRLIYYDYGHNSDCGYDYGPLEVLDEHWEKKEKHEEEETPVEIYASLALSSSFSLCRLYSFSY